jgi:hypothetical protein
MKQHSLRVLCAAIVCLVAGSVALAAHNLPSDIEAAAQKSVGKKMWFGYGLAKGTLGCAAAQASPARILPLSQWCAANCWLRDWRRN